MAHCEGVAVAEPVPNDESVGGMVGAVDALGKVEEVAQLVPRELTEGEAEDTPEADKVRVSMEVRVPPPPAAPFDALTLRVAALVRLAVVEKEGEDEVLSEPLGVAVPQEVPLPPPRAAAAKPEALPEGLVQPLIVTDGEDVAELEREAEDDAEPQAVTRPADGDTLDDTVGEREGSARLGEALSVPAPFWVCVGVPVIGSESDPATLPETCVEGVAEGDVEREMEGDEEEV